jgi:ATP-binding cassette subfamily B protein
LGIVFVAISNFLKLFVPHYISKLIDTVIQTPFNNIEAYVNLIIVFGIKTIGLTLLSGIATFMMRQTIIVVSRKIETNLKNEVFFKILRAPIMTLQSIDHGDLMVRLTEDIGRIREAIGPGFLHVFNLFFTILLCLIFMVEIHWIMTFLAIAPMIILAWSIKILNSKIYDNNILIQEQLSDLNLLCIDAYQGIKTLKTYHSESFINEIFQTKSKDLYTTQVKNKALESLFLPIMGLLSALSTILSIGAGVFLYRHGGVTIGEIIAFLMYLGLMMWPFTAFGWVTNMIQRGISCYDRIIELLHLPEETQTKLTEHIDFEQITLRNFDTKILTNQILSNINLEFKKGKKYLIVGEIASGKSILLESLLGFYQINPSSYFINGKDVCSLKLNEIRQYFAFVPQEHMLFSNSIAENIYFSNEVNETKIYKTAENAQFSVQILDLPQGYQTIIGEKGVVLSGGQKQRLSIARALYHDAPILLFDDCLSALDMKTEHDIVAYIESLDEQKTLIMSSHRVFHQLKFDEIIVLNQGKIAEIGSHDELILRGGFYSEIYEKQKVEGI